MFSTSNMKGIFKIVSKGYPIILPTLWANPKQVAPAIILVQNLVNVSVIKFFPLPEHIPDNSWANKIKQNKSSNQSALSIELIRVFKSRAIPFWDIILFYLFITKTWWFFKNESVRKAARQMSGAWIQLGIWK